MTAAISGSSLRLSPRLSFKTSPSSFSALGFWLGITAFFACGTPCICRPIPRELRQRLCCKSLPVLRFSWFEPSGAGRFVETICYNLRKLESVASVEIYDRTLCETAMSYPCPKCGARTEPRRVNITHVAGGPSVGLLYVLFFPFFAKRWCPDHGFIAAEEFPPSVRRRLSLFPVLWLVGCVVVMGGIGWIVLRLVG